MNILNARILFGNELILRYNDLFEQLLNSGIFDEINCSIDKDNINIHRGNYGDQYYNDNYDTAKFVMSNNKINVTTSDEYPFYGIGELRKDYNISEKLNLNKKLIDKKLNIKLPKRYITISTKIQNANFNREIFDRHSKEFFEILNSYEGDIIILGEQRIENCSEYDIHKPFVIYDDIIKNLNRYHDFTVPNSTFNSNLEFLKRTFFILNKSKLNIHLSCSGIKTIMLYVSNNILALSDVDISNRSNKDNIFIYNNFGEVLNKLKNYVYST